MATAGLKPWWRQLAGRLQVPVFRNYNFGDICNIAAIAYGPFYENANWYGNNRKPAKQA